MLEAHIFGRSGSAGEAQLTFQNASTALTLLSGFIVDTGRDIERLGERQAHLSFKVFLTNGADVHLLLTPVCLSSA